MTAEQKVVQALGGWDEASGAQIARLFLFSWNLYPALLALERVGIIRSRWAGDGSKYPWMPRRRLYRLAIPFDAAKRITDMHRSDWQRGMAQHERLSRSCRMEEPRT